MPARVDSGTWGQTKAERLASVASVQYIKRYEMIVSYVQAFYPRLVLFVFGPFRKFKDSRLGIMVGTHA